MMRESRGMRLPCAHPASPELASPPPSTSSADTASAFPAHPCGAGDAHRIMRLRSDERSRHARNDGRGATGVRVYVRRRVTEARTHLPQKASGAIPTALDTAASTARGGL